MHKCFTCLRELQCDGTLLSMFEEVIKSMTETILRALLMSTNSMTLNGYFLFSSVNEQYFILDTTISNQ